MLAPTLLVGLGGTGSKIVCRVANLVSEEQRQRLAFAAFDTDINELRELQRINPFVKVIQTSTKLTVGEYLNIDTHARDTWFPVNSILNSKTLTEGAGQVRAVSRLAFETAVRAGKLEPLHEAIQELYKVEEGQSEQALRVVIVSSLAGGTGSGLILPVALYIKNYLATRFRQSANITRGFFILPEVFDEVIKGKAERSNLRANAYATLRELDAFLMKGDDTLPEQFRESVHIQFPRTGSNGYEEYHVRPYDFCFLFDAQNSEGSKLNSFNQYLDHAANCIYAQSIGPMNKRSNSSEDNTIRRLCEERGRNRYAGAGSSMLVYPMEDVREYIALNWARECVSKQWLVFDNVFRAQRQRQAAMRTQGINTPEIDAGRNYVATVESMANNNDPFARAIIQSCAEYEDDGTTKRADKWDSYVAGLMQKIRADESAGQGNLDAQKLQAQTMISELGGGKDSWEAYQDAYRALEKYRLMIQKRYEEVARTIAYTMFKAPNDNATQERLSYRLESYLRDASGNFIHPNAVRYFLYKTLELMKAQQMVVEGENAKALKLFDTFSHAHFDDEKTDDVEETVEDLSSRKIALINRLTGKPTGEQEDLRGAYSGYLATVNKYRVNSVLAMVLKEGIDYVTDLCEAFSSFFLSFENKVSGLDRRVNALAKKHENTKGMTARYVCSSRKCLEAMSKKMIYTGGTITLDSKLAEGIYERVRKYSLLTTKPQNGGYFDDIFEKGILGFFRTSLMKTYSGAIDLDILSALEAEAEYEEGIVDDAQAELYVRDAIRSTRALSCPFIEKPLGEERDPIFACTFNKFLDPRDDSPRSKLVEHELKNAGGEEDEDIGKNMILFYQSFYGLRANDLSKFAPPERSITSNRDAGEYYKAYFDLIRMLHPEAPRSRAITPHIDRWWHVITKMPDLDEENQIMQEQQVYAAFFWALANNYVELYDAGAEKKAYRLMLDDDSDLSMGDDVLVVSNGTECDHLYEVLDAFAIYPELVEKVLRKIDRMTLEDVDCATPVSEGFLMDDLNSFRLREYPLGESNRVRSIFDVPILMKRSLKSELYFEENVLHILRAEISEIRRYLLRFVTKKDLPTVMGGILRQQYELFMKDIEEDPAIGKAFYSDVLFSRICVIIAKAFEDLQLSRDAREIRAKARELSK